MTARITVDLARLRRGLAAWGLAAALGISGCAFDPSDIPVPGAMVAGDSYRLRIEFTNVLNLPARAKVIANGAQVGNVDTVEVVPGDTENPGYVVVDIEVQDSVELPASTIAELRQNTVLGDIHIALSTPPDGYGTLLRPGDTITRDHTRPPVQLEDTMAAIAFFVNSGSVGQLQDIVDRVNSVLPQDPAETKRIAQVLATDTVDLAAHLDQVDLLLHGVASNAEVMHGIQDELDNILRPESVQQMNAATESIAGVTEIFSGLGPVGQSLSWLAPLAQSGGAAAAAFVPLATGGPLDLRQPSNLNLLVALLRDKVIPFVENGPRVNIRSVRAGDPLSTDDQVSRIIETLRMIGAVR
ncbi:MlaD family protein [Nocardia jinanensis]|uniref:Mce family protein n=1 Tax=Nocardia jinanensis TaxID=382504 RepID=A0A917RUK3_9NOCA|nr:MlaD family protein [Nocardia jinanensis]GGL32281.1 putative Mce family protein [Nocardia jinanensis]